MGFDFYAGSSRGGGFVLVLVWLIRVHNCCRITSKINTDTVKSIIVRGDFCTLKSLTGSS